MMSQFLTINKLEGHMIVKQGVSIVKVINKDFEFLIFFCMNFYSYRLASQEPLQTQVQHILPNCDLTFFMRLQWASDTN